MSEKERWLPKSRAITHDQKTHFIIHIKSTFLLTLKEMFFKVHSRSEFYFGHTNSATLIKIGSKLIYISQKLCTETTKVAQLKENFVLPTLDEKSNRCH